MAGRRGGAESAAAPAWAADRAGGSGNDCADIGERLATAGLWLAGEDGRLSDPWDADTRWYHGLEMLWGFEREPEAACFDERRGWASSFSVERSHAEVAIALATGSLAHDVSVTAEQGAVLMGPPEGGELDDENIEDAREELAKLGIHWR